jgi:hypothetical protein
MRLPKERLSTDAIVEWIKTDSEQAAARELVKTKVRAGDCERV